MGRTDEGADEKKRSGAGLQIVLALIGLVGVAAGALFANWDKVFGSRVAAVETPSTASSGSSDEVSPEPSPDRCNVTLPFPPRERLFLVGWSAVEGAASYRVEYDCFGCDTYGRQWHSIAAGQPWHLSPPGIGFRSPIYSSNVHHQFYDEGGLSMRWRVWAVDHENRRGGESAWCNLTFAGPRD